MNLVSLSINVKAFRSLSLRSTSHRFHVSCAAKPETVDKVCKIVRKQLALSDDTSVTGESNCQCGEWRVETHENCPARSTSRRKLISPTADRVLPSDDCFRRFGDLYSCKLPQIKLQIALVTASYGDSSISHIVIGNRIDCSIIHNTQAAEKIRCPISLLLLLL